MKGFASGGGRLSRPLAVLIALGLYLTTRGYHSRDGDQAYRLPLLLHRQAPALYANDPFVRAFDGFNPHRGYLALLDAASWPLGLSVALAALFAATFVLTCLAFERLAGLCWPRGGTKAGAAAVAMLLVAKAGNIGTNHLFEAMLLDRLIALGFGWMALGDLLDDPPRSIRAALLLGLATLVHPSLGLQLGMLAAAGWAAWSLMSPRTGISTRSAIAGLGFLVVGMAPGVALMAGAGSKLMEGLPPEDFYALSALVQGPQHMVPHLWRMPQWLAWACYPALAALSVIGSRGEEPSKARARMAILLVVNLAGLLLAWFAIEVLGSIRATVFQPFRMATTARGLCLVLASDRVGRLWTRGDAWGRCRAALLVVGLVGDWIFVIAAAVELGSTLASRFGRLAERAIGAVVISAGAVYLARHDTESGHWPLLAALGLAAAWSLGARWGLRLSWNRRRVFTLASVCWIVPGLALMPASLVPGKFGERLASHCRFGETPVDDVERLAAWCRDHTPKGARFLGPPGPKTFRLWSRRELAFNRAAGPYHAAGLADWAARFRDHVGFRGTIADFARAYLEDRQGLERRYEAMSDANKADLARRQGADHVIAAAPRPGAAIAGGPLELLRVEGRFAAYRVSGRVHHEAAKGTEVATKGKFPCPPVVASSVPFAASWWTRPPLRFNPGTRRP